MPRNKLEVISEESDAENSDDNEKITYVRRINELELENKKLKESLVEVKKILMQIQRQRKK